MNDLFVKTRPRKDMKKYLVISVFTSVLLIFSIFTLLSIPEVNAEEVISVNAVGYENTIIIEFENESTSKIKTVRVWLGEDVLFESFKTEPGWGGGKYSDGKLVIFTATDTLNPGESVKFGLTTNEKVGGINWKVEDRNNKSIDTRKTSIQEISHTVSSYVEDESKIVEAAKETGSELYGTKTFIPTKIRVDSDVRLVGSEFGAGEKLDLYLNSAILKSVTTDEKGNFLTTIKIPADINTGNTEFIIKDQNENIQTTTINIGEAKNRFLKSSQFTITTIPADINYDESLIISGSAYPQTGVILTFENANGVYEKVRVVNANSNGEWVFEEMVNRNESLGEKFLILQNNENRVVKNITVKSGNAIEIATDITRYNAGDTVTVTGISEPNTNTTIWVKDASKRILIFDVVTADQNGKFDYEFVLDDGFSIGTHAIIAKHAQGNDATLFGVGQYPTTYVVGLLEKSNFPVNSKAVLNLIGPPTSRLSITILDSNDNIKLSDSVTTSSIGKTRYTMNLESLSSGVYRVAISLQNIQESVKFSIGSETGSGDITLNPTKSSYSPSESILLFGSTGSNARITINLIDPAGQISSTTEIFSDGLGQFSTENLGIPSNGVLGDWKLTAYSKLDSTTITIKVSVPLEQSIKLQIVETDFLIGDTVIIKGVAKSDTNRLHVTITYEDGEEITSLDTPLSDGEFSVPWVVPNDSKSGTYTIVVSDNENSDSAEILIQ